MRMSGLRRVHGRLVRHPQGSSFVQELSIKREPRIVAGPTQVKESVSGREPPREAASNVKASEQREWRTFAHAAFFRECIGRVSRLNFLYALCLGIRRRRNEDGLRADGRVRCCYGAVAGRAIEPAADWVWGGDWRDS